MRFLPPPPFAPVSRIRRAGCCSLLDLRFYQADSWSIWPTLSNPIALFLSVTFHMGNSVRRDRPKTAFLYPQGPDSGRPGAQESLPANRTMPILQFVFRRHVHILSMLRFAAPAGLAPAGTAFRAVGTAIRRLESLIHLQPPSGDRL
jgi:hypothetical protein